MMARALANLHRVQHSQSVLHAFEHRVLPHLLVTNIARLVANDWMKTPIMMMTAPIMMVIRRPTFSTSHQRNVTAKTLPRPCVPLKIPSCAPVG